MNLRQRIDQLKESRGDDGVLLSQEGLEWLFGELEARPDLTPDFIMDCRHRSRDEHVELEWNHIGDTWFAILKINLSTKQANWFDALWDDDTKDFEADLDLTLPATWDLINERLQLHAGGDKQ